MTQRTDRAPKGRAIVLQPGEGNVLPGPEGITLKATGRDTNGAIGFFEATWPPGFGPPRHVHYSNDELFYILEGEFRILVGDEIVNARAGSFVFIPRGTVHAPKVVGNGAGKVLAAFVPGGQELSFEEFTKLDLGDDASAEQAQVIARRYDSEFVGPPL